MQDTQSAEERAPQNSNRSSTILGAAVPSPQAPFSLNNVSVETKEFLRQQSRRRSHLVDANDRFSKGLHHATNKNIGPVSFHILQC